MDGLPANRLKGAVFVSALSHIIPCSATRLFFAVKLPSIDRDRLITTSAFHQDPFCHDIFLSGGRWTQRV